MTARKLKMFCLSMRRSFNGDEDMTEIMKQEEDLEAEALSSCRVQWVDERNALCMVHRPECRCATPYGNFCEHPEVMLIRDDRLGE